MRRREPKARNDASPHGDDHALALEAATRAGTVRALRSDPALVGERLGRAGDRQANAAIVQLLRRERPGDALLSEELKPDDRRLAQRRVWIVHPLDGTREFSEAGARSDWAVHVALCVDGVPVVCTVDLSAKDTAISTIRRIEELSAMGFTHVIFIMPDVYSIKPLETVAKEIIPSTKEL